MRSLLAIAFVLAAVLAGALMLDGQTGPTVPSIRERVEEPKPAPPNPPTPALSPRETAATDASSKTTARPDQNPAPHSRAEVTVTQPGLFGSLHDHLDDPLAGITIRLLRPGARGHEAKWATTGGDGKFGFADVHGTFDCAVWNHVRINESVTIAPGERKEIALRILEPCVLVHGTVRAGSRLVNDRTVGVHGQDATGDVHHDAHTDAQGVYRHLLRPGSYEISVVGPPTSIAWSIKGTTVWAETSTTAMSKQRLQLASALTRVEHNFQLPPARVHVRVQTPDHRPIDTAEVTIRSLTDPEMTWTRRTDNDGSIAFEELPAGHWKLTARHEMHLTPLSQDVATRTNDGTQEVAFVMVPAGAAIVKLVHNGEAYEPLDARQLELHIAGRPTLKGTRATGGKWVYQGTRFDAAPAGTHELHCCDVLRPDGSIRFAPIEPLAPQRVTIEPGKTTETEILVQRRPHLVVSVAGGPDSNTTIEVSCHEGRVVPSHRGHDHWRAEVPAGNYTIKVRRGEVVKIDQMSVFRDDVEHVVDLGQ